MDPRFYLRDWGAWGWIWALGWLWFVLGIVLIPEFLKGTTSSIVFLLPLAGAALMLASSRFASRQIA